MEGTEDFIAVMLLLLSNVSVTPGSTDVAAIFISNDEIFVALVCFVYDDGFIDDKLFQVRSQCVWGVWVNIVLNE